MSTPAVTDAPAASSSHERETASHFLPTDEKYRLTGELPEHLVPAATQLDQEEHIPETIREEREREKAAQQQKDPAVTEDASAASDSDTEAASEAAQRAEKPGKTQATSESRWAKITRENKELREWKAKQEAVEAERQAASTRETQQAPQPAAETKSEGRPEPKIDDVDEKTGKPKYSTYTDYLNDVRKWDREQNLREFQEQSAKTERERQQAQARQTIERTVNERVAKARKDHADYDEVMAEGIAAKNEHGQDLIYIPEGSPIDLFLLRSPRGQDVFYEVAKNLAEHGHIFARDAQGKFLTHPVDQLRALAQIEFELGGNGPKSTSPPASLKPVTQAGRPPHQVSGKGTVAKDAVEQAVDDGDVESYIREQNARALAARKK